MAVRFLAVGELLVDVVAAGAGHGARIRVRPAGSAFNAAVAAAAAGADAAVIGTVGDDAAGRMIVRELEAHGVRPIVSRVEGVTGTFLLADGEIRVDRGDSHRLGVAEPVAADAVLVSGYLPHAADVLASAEGTWVALDAARLSAASARRQRRDRERGDRATADRPERRAGRTGARRAVPARLRHAAARTARSRFSTAGWRPPGRTPSTRTRWGPVTRSQQPCSSGWPEGTIWAGHCETAAALPERRSRTGTSARRRGS